MNIFGLIRRHTPAAMELILEPKLLAWGVPLPEVAYLLNFLYNYQLPHFQKALPLMI